MVVGVDGARSGWIAVAKDGGDFSLRVFPSARSLVDAFPSVLVIAVDVPIGLTDREGRAAEREARKFVGGRRACSIFSTPVRGILHARTQPEASRCHRAIDGRGFGAQSFGILSKIREWDALLRGDAAARAVTYEIHPEVSFAHLNGGVGLVAGKKKPEGASMRRHLLAGVFGADVVDDIVARTPRAEAALDDVLDALAALWSARRIADGAACSLPSPPAVDSVGLRMAIHY
jgi:predicted RNase H-like nuclease